MTFSATQLSNAFSIATKYIDGQIPVVFEMEHPLLKKILDRKEYANGESLQFPINFKKMQNISTISGTTADVINTNTQQNATFAALSWKMFQEGFAVNLEELTRATGDTAVKDIIAMKAENTIESFRDFLHQQFYGSATTNPKDLNGLLDIFAASGTAYAGLTDTDFDNDVAGDSLWLTKIDSTEDYPSYSKISPYITGIKAKKATALDYLISTPSIFQRYKDLQQASGQRYVGAADLKSGFDSIMIDGVPFIPDAYCTTASSTAHYLYGITSDTMGLKYKFGWDKPSPLDDQGIKIPNQPLLFRNKYYSANFYCNNRRLNFVMKALNPAATS